MTAIQEIMQVGVGMPDREKFERFARDILGFPSTRSPDGKVTYLQTDQHHHRIAARAAPQPVLDYVVVKVPRFAFEKFPAADPTLTTTMKSVGEAMALGRNFTEALGKALRSLEDPDARFDFTAEITESIDELLQTAARPHDGRLQVVPRIIEDRILEIAREFDEHLPVQLRRWPLIVDRQQQLALGVHGGPHPVP